MTRILLFATYPTSSNGYSKVAYELAKYLSSKPDIILTYYGFQNFQKNPMHEQERILPSNVQLYDAFANEKNKQLGFGFEEITDFVTLNKPDICIVYNDMVVISNVIEQLKKVQNRKFKIMTYVDQVYLYYTNEENEDGDRKIKVSCNSYIDKDKIESLVLDVFDMDLESFNERFTDYEFFHDVFDQTKNNVRFTLSAVLKAKMLECVVFRVITFGVTFFNTDHSE